MWRSRHSRSELNNSNIRQHRQLSHHNNATAMAQPQPPLSSSEAPCPPSSGAAYTPPPPGQGPQGPQGYPGAYAPNYQQPPNYYQAPPPVPAHTRPPLVSIISPDDAKKIRKMQLINFAATMFQLGCSLAIILIVRNSLYRVSFNTVGNQVLLNTQCLAATASFPGTCEYAYSLASVSIFFGFILSLMQCLTMDCCGAGRAIEAGFDAAATFWWVAGGIYLGIRAAEANAEGVPEVAARNGVVALCWISAFFFGVLLCTNMVLIKRLGKAYKAAAQQMQQHLTAMPVTGYPHGQGGVQMGHMGGAPAGYPPQSTPPQYWGAPGGPPPPGPAAMGAGGAPVGGVHPTQTPAGYPAQFTPPAANGVNSPV